MMKFVNVVVAASLLLMAQGCATLKPTPELCDTLKESVFAVGTFGCMKVQDSASKDICLKAALAGALVARAGCLAKLAAGQAPEVGDPLSPEDAALTADAEAIVNEWKALEQPRQP